MPRTRPTQKPPVLRLEAGDLVSWCATTADPFAFKVALKRFDADAWPDAAARLDEMLRGSEAPGDPGDEGLRSVRDRRAGILMRRLKIELLQSEVDLRQRR